MIIHPRAEASVRVRIGSITGVHVNMFECNHASTSLRIGVHGRSPSLNRVTMVWEATTHLGPEDPEGQARDILSCIAPHLTIQEDRAEDGLKLGTATPLRIVEDDGSADDTQCGHILVDRDLAALWLATHPDGPGREVGDGIYDIHHVDQGERDGLETKYASQQTHLSDEPWAGWNRLHGRTMFRDLRLAAGAFFDGRTLRLAASLPETVVLASVGRRLDEVADVPDEIASRIIVDARVRDDPDDEDGYGETVNEFDIDPRLVSVDEVMRRAGSPED